MRTRIEICMGSSCHPRGNKDNLELIMSFIAERGLEAEVELAGSLCQGKCAAGPVVKIGGALHTKVDKGALRDLLEAAFKRAEAAE